MKKIIITSLFFICLVLMAFEGALNCNVSRVIVIAGAQVADIAVALGGLELPGDGGAEAEYYTIYVGENGVIVRSSGDTNISFQQKTSGTTQRLNSLRVTPSPFNGTVLAVGNNGAITRSTNTGNTWIASTPVTSANLYGAEFNFTYDYAVGDNGTILWSFDGGANWSQVQSGTTRNLKAIGLNPNFQSVVVAVGEKGTIVRSTNSGQNWTNISLADTTVNFYDISKKGLYYIDGSDFCIVGSGGRIYKSTDDGETWVQKPSETTNTLRSIYQHTADSIVVVGDNGTVRFSTNGGENWFTDQFFNSPSSRNFKSVTLINRYNHTYSALSDTLWFVSEDTVTIIGIHQISTETPEKFSLSQNYPNPFNPATKIGFELPKSSFAKLVVYDITGREIETLVNENLHAGVYEYDWNGINLPSGVYFYKLTAENFIETKKMILIK